LDPPGQANNQVRPTTLKTALAIVKDGVEHTAKEWADLMKLEEDTIRKYAQQKKNGFAYKEYPDLEGEDWKPIYGERWKDVIGSAEKPEEYWEISNMKRVKYVTAHAENVISGDTLGLNMGYPTIKINGKQWRCHILAFRAFNSELWDVKRDDEMVLHKVVNGKEDKKDFRPHMLYLGNASMNAIDARDSGKYDGKKTARMKCASYIDGVHEENHDSQTDAAAYLRSKGYPKASINSISVALSGKYKTAYGRTWIKL
jgi:hypothetical protein